MRRMFRSLQSRQPRRHWYLCAFALLVGCKSSSRGNAGPIPPFSKQELAYARPAMAEEKRDSTVIDGELLSTRDSELRIRAARALARIADARSAELLLLALADEDPEVSTWGAYGLGYACQGRETKTVHALVARAASLSDAAPASTDTTGTAGGPPTVSATAATGATALASPVEAISDALGRCAGSEAESTLRAWLRGPHARAEAAALGLGHIASQTGKLDDTTLVALLDAADRAQDPLRNALFPVTRLASLNPSTAERTRTLATQLIANHQPGAEFALRSLSRTGEAGATALGSLLADTQLAPGLRAEAARELGTLGGAGQRPLWTAFDSTFATPPSDVTLTRASYGPLGALVDALVPPILGSGAHLQTLADLPIGGSDSVSLVRRKVHLRCAAAALLAGSNFQSPRLVACDPAPESAPRELCVISVIGREKLRGARKKAYLLRAQGKDGTVREAALDLLAEHSELDEAYRVLADALAAKSLGVVASAARVLTRYPERAARIVAATSDAHGSPNPDPSVVKAIAQAYAAAGAQNSVEVQSLLLDAIGALQILTSKDAANDACGSENPTLREHAQKTLRLLGEQSRQCAESKPNQRMVFGHPRGAFLVSLDTDAGPLTLKLDARYAPAAVDRIVTLVKTGFYDGMAVHRVVPGFVAQFGDPEGDGYGGDDKPPLRCETSPLPFGIGAVGVALAGRDTGSSQLFVTLGRHPHLDGQYAWLGEAGPGWDQLAAGDRILHAHVSDAP